MTNHKKSIFSPGVYSSSPSESPIIDAAAIPVDTNAHTGIDRESRTDRPQLPHETRTNSRGAEQRKAKRFPLSLAATVRWLGSDNLVHEELGTVWDISTCGVFVEVATKLPTNTAVELEITSLSLLPDRPRSELHFEGKIVRTDSRAPRRGFAATGVLSLVRPGRVCADPVAG